jgi:outer membrane usher protein
VAGALEDYDPSELRLSLTIPQAFLSRRALNSVPPGLLTRGENAGYANYNFNYFQAAQSNSSFLGLNSGINLQGWQVRHTSYLTHSNTEGSGSVQQYVAGETFVRRPLIDWRATLALGEIVSTSPIVGSVPRCFLSKPCPPAHLNLPTSIPQRRWATCKCKSPRPTARCKVFWCPTA